MKVDPQEMAAMREEMKDSPLSFLMGGGSGGGSGANSGATQPALARRAAGSASGAGTGAVSASGGTGATGTSAKRRK